MNKEFKFKINNIFNIFTSDSLTNTISKYHLNSYCSLNQIHSDTIISIDDNYQNNSTGDAMITNQKNIPLVIKTADCIPILLYDQKKAIIAVVHAGWKGILNDITIKTINKMITEFNCNPNDIVVYLYPSIRKCHFEIEIDVYTLFKNKIKNLDNYTTKKGNKYYIDLQQILIDSIKKMHIDNIIDSNICTYCNHDKFYSYRYNHTAKRNYLIGMIEE